ncbi:MAG: hypothetical protein KJ578_14735 [Bacteroidetes bacterium]|nr:hypothetical protein [Bacteroidota bacterium]MBU1580052.1 hypothetical protein [Bacteroidota bacterium]MBU2465408.1 hypothetical protein [Bacteroidota bacterium]MBU2559032.1 hypothetical protein [Bacteroidota bacterium]
MKSQTLITVVLAVLLCSTGFAQIFDFPDVSLRDKNNRLVSVAELTKKGQLSILVFWDIDDRKSCQLLQDMAIVYADSLQGYPINFVAVAVPKSGNYALAANYARVNASDINCLTDENAKLSRHLGINEFPWAMLFDVDQKLVCQYRGYCVGVDEKLCHEVKICLEKLKL